MILLCALHRQKLMNVTVQTVAKRALARLRTVQKTTTKQNGRQEAGKHSSEVGK
jgi:hypothetical protein